MQWNTRHFSVWIVECFLNGKSEKEERFSSKSRAEFCAECFAEDYGTNSFDYVTVTIREIRTPVRVYEKGEE